MAKLTIKTEATLNKALAKLTPSWENCFPEATVVKAQVAKSQSRNYMFGKIINAKFIELSKASAGFKKGDIVSLVDLYAVETAQNIAGLIIYRLGNSGLMNEPTIVKA